MTDPVLQLLFERLLWPPPRVRWETVRSIAQLIRQGDQGAAEGLLTWMAGRSIESEAVIGLSIIDAFELGTHFEFKAVSAAVKAPSHLSDLLLQRNFADAHNLFRFRYTISPTAPAPLPAHQEHWFEENRRYAIPRSFSTNLRKLEEMSGYPFMARWEHDWRWLQTTYPRMSFEPRFFYGGDRDYVGQFDLPIREIYVSAYLRTLAFAAVEWRLPHERAEEYALAALLLNRGLADLTPVERPAWTRGLLGEPRTPDRMAQHVWSQAKSMCGKGEVPLAVHVVDQNDENCVEVRLALVIGPQGSLDEEAIPDQLRWISPLENPGDFFGRIGKHAAEQRLPLDSPVEIVQGVVPTDLGRFHSCLGDQIQMVSPYILGHPVTLASEPTSVRLEGDRGVISRWTHWYASWAPTHPQLLDAPISWLATIDETVLGEIQTREGLETAYFVSIRELRREYTYTEHKLSEALTWLRP